VKKPVKVHPELKTALAKNRKARETFEGFSPSHRREYVEWIAEAKGDDTRKRRIATAIEWLSEGKPRNWKYMRSRRNRKPPGQKPGGFHFRAPAPYGPSGGLYGLGTLGLLMISAALIGQHFTLPNVTVALP
jgi:hypothetical protein